MTELPAVIRHAIHTSDLTMTGLADELGVSQRTVRNWATGHTTPRFVDVVRLARVTGVPLEAFAAAVDHQPAWVQCAMFGDPVPMDAPQLAPAA